MKKFSNLSISQSALLILTVSLLGCKDSDTTETGDIAQDLCTEPIAIDHDSDPDVIEVHLTASASTWNPGNGVLDGLAYNNCVPGPMIVGELGNTLRVIFDNDLEYETTIHWHGFRLPNEMDGTPAVQNPVKPGESFVYEFELVDAGLYWYHPHVDVDLQVEQGLHGSIWVRDPAAPEVDATVVVIDDVAIGSDGQIEPRTEGMMAIMGRLGNLLLANGDMDLEVPIAPNSWKLLALVNSANTRFFELELEGHDMLIVGSDGGFLNDPVPADRIVLAPGERSLVLVRGVGESGERYGLLNYQHSIMSEDMGGGMGMGGMEGGDSIPDGSPVFELVYTDDTAETTEQPLFPADQLEAMTPGEVSHRWILGGGMGGVFTIDDETYPNVPLVSAEQGQRTFEIQNDTTMAHPFHIHGERFQVLDADYLAWKDTFIVPAGETITVMSDLSNPGDWMYHCHILEHEEGGMMGIFQVLEATEVGTDTGATY